MTAKEILLKVKALFDAPAAPAVPATPATPTAKTYKTKDGAEISIAQAGEMPAAGDMVMIAGAPAPEGTLTLEDGSTITIDATGMITMYTPVAMAAPPVPAVPAPPAQPITLSAEEVQAMYSKFATGTPEERLTNLETMVKALMECNFGYEIRKGQESQAILVYKESLAPVQTAVTTATTQLQSAFEKVEAQQLIITRHEETIKGLFELVEKLVELPTADPATLNGVKKEKFEQSLKREKSIEGIAAAIGSIKKLN